MISMFFHVSSCFLQVSILLLLFVGFDLPLPGAAPELPKSQGVLRLAQPCEW